MKSKALIRLVPSARGFHITYLAVDFTLLCFAAMRDDAYAEALIVSQRESETNARRVIHTLGIEGSEVRCPEGTVRLPLDIWCCKLTQQICRLQAFIDVADKQKFVAGCHAPEKKKEDIYRTLADRKYSGFHHVPGRFLCPSCADSKTSGSPFSYHYLWETALLDVALGMTYEEAEALMSGHQRNHSYLYSRLCAPCCLRVSQQIAPNAADGLELLEFDINPR